MKVAASAAAFTSADDDDDDWRTRTKVLGACVVHIFVPLYGSFEKLSIGFDSVPL